MLNNIDEDVQPRTERGKSATSTFPRNGDIDVEIQGGSKGWAKYSVALQTLLPFRKETPKKYLPSSHAGMFSFVSFSWLTPIMWKAFRQGLSPVDLWELHDADKAEKNAKRLNRIWQNEKVLVGEDKASFMKCIWKFGKTRFYVCIFFMLVSICFQFMGPSWILKAVLIYQDDTTQPLEIGIALAVAALVAQFLRNLTYTAVWAIGIHTGMRVGGAMQYLTYDKMLRLRNGGDNILSKTITFCTNDQERIFECVSGGVLAVAAPVMFLFCLIYSCIVLGPWAILGNVVIFLFYPLMGAIARRTALIRRKAVRYTNKRVGLMTEIMNSIRLIKMYGWEESFLKKVKEIRVGEEHQLRTAAFLQSITATIIPMINIFASIAVFLAYTLSGNNLTPAEAFTLFSVFSAMSFTFGTLPFALRAIGEASVCFRNFQKFLDLPEFEVVTEQDLDVSHDAVIAIKDGSFAWEVEKPSDPLQESQTPAEKKKAKKSKKIKENSKPNTNGKPNPGDEEANPEQQMLPEENKKADAMLLQDCLENINLEIKRGFLLGISGTVGSGKSALIASILGEMVKTSGKMLIRGSLAVVPQQSWIYSDSVQENIIFGSPLNKEKYDKVIDICCLRSDIASFSNGDLTLVGERGVTLSGGQKQRINLARSVYADKSIYLLDDPLSAVDSIVAQEIFEKCIKTHLKDKTVLLITSSVQFLEECDEIIFMKDGEIVEHGTHEQLVVEKQNYYNMLQYHNQNKSKTEDTIPLISENDVKNSISYESPAKKIKKSSNPVESFAQKIIEDDSLYKFAGIKAYLHYLKAAGGYSLFGILLIFFLVFGAGKQSTQVWLRFWLDDGDGKMAERLANSTEESNVTLTESDLRGFVNENPRIWFYQIILVALLFSTLLAGLIKGLMSSRFVLRGASGLHSAMLHKVVNSPMSFFDKTPVGKITNRFSKDLDELDARLPFFFEFVIQSVIFILLSLLITCVIYPEFAFGMIFVLGLMIFFDIWLNIGVRETRKLENVLKTPVIHHLQSSLSGLSIIRTFHRQDPFKSRFSSYVNNHLAAESVYRSANRWFTFRMDGICMFTIFGTILTTVLLRGRVSSALVGLALSNIYSVCIFVPFVMRMKSELQARFLSVERVLEYAEELEEEEPESKIVIKPSSEWPMTPSIKFENCSLRYQADLPFVIEGVSFDVQPAEKIGIVGRTGAGKTSIIAAICRLYSVDEGRIFVGDLNISEISLKDLRASIAVIPQDPVLFQGTLRYNLDPFNQHTDEQLWTALEKSHIKAKIEKEEKKLLQAVASEGDNFSIGEKQLICLARSLLRKNKILLLDEATASLDIETDFLIQNTIREAFKACTVITVAHRLNTIAFYDRILVMDKGKMIELDTPQNLMANEDSRFHKMMIASGISSLDQLRAYRVSSGESSDSNDSPT